MMPDKNIQKLMFWFVFAAILLMSTNVYAERIKDLASVAGVRNNQLAGYGIVV